jgi:hypothetical protein
MHIWTASHTPETTESGNIHGMPLAALMGYGDSRLTQLLFSAPKLLPESVILIGIRSFEKAEAALLKRLNVRIFDMYEIQTRGLTAVITEAVEIVSKNTVGYGISIDIDSIDPEEAPGTGAKELNGIASQDLCTALQKLLLSPDKRFIGAEIAEFDPNQDKNKKTEKIIFEWTRQLRRNIIISGSCCPPLFNTHRRKRRSTVPTDSPRRPCKNCTIVSGKIYTRKISFNRSCYQCSGARKSDYYYDTDIAAPMVRVWESKITSHSHWHHAVYGTHRRFLPI